MDTALKTVGNLLPYHLLSYGALLGTELFQSFVNTKICFQALPMREFIGLQKRIFPVYFGCQVGLAALTAATRPPYSVLSLGQDAWGTTSLVVVLVTGTLNWFVFGPRTTTASFVRRALHENQDKSDDPDGRVNRANRNFARNHAMAIHLNAISLVATIFYGFSFASSLLEGL
ncbi:hypothetical protein N7492_000112 [Penicillium capsulatum]|uniref:TMEM205-like domain-containing protein n=1 Tax=Penicillium capsulatum TaxID=69766 RepID=A0A9W9IS41_9EURO|nr:hypothetical protein N7492_000112 [Penicillium capsulatum]KAJ6130821.1 hypothetical protein N7512_003601 [Penicillium capsulatum]